MRHQWAVAIIGGLIALQCPLYSVGAAPQIGAEYAPMIVAVAQPHRSIMHDRSCAIAGAKRGFLGNLFPDGLSL